MIRLGTQNYDSIYGSPSLKPKYYYHSYNPQSDSFLLTHKKKDKTKGILTAIAASIGALILIKNRKNIKGFLNNLKKNAPKAKASASSAAATEAKKTGNFFKKLFSKKH